MGLVSTTSVLVGIVIGSGIFRVPAEVAREVGSVGATTLLWVVGAALSLGGALTLAELCGRYPQAGGAYVFLREAYGPLIGFLFGGNPFLLLLVAAIWGATVIADSAQFSACVTELGDPRYVGTALTMQTCIGFLLTSVSIELVPHFVTLVGWRYAFAILAPGPMLGVIAMLRLRSLPEATKIAHGRR